MGWLKKITRPISKVLDKIIPNEIKPALPYLSAAAPFMLGPGIMGTTMLKRALMSGALNLGSQLAQEGSEGEFNPLSLAMASGIGALSAPGTESITGADRFLGPDGKMISVPYEIPGQAGAEQFFMEKASGMDSGLTKSGLELLGKGSKYLTGAAETLQTDPFSKAGLKASIVPITQGTADLAMISAQQALDDYNEGLEEGSEAWYDDDARRVAIRRAMEMAGHVEDDIVSALEALGLREGGIVGLKKGGRIGYQDGELVEESEVVEESKGDNVLVEIAKVIFKLVPPTSFMFAAKDAYDMYQNLEDEDKQKVQEIGKRGLSRFAGVPGLAASAGMSLMDKFKGKEMADGGRIGMVSGGGLKGAWAAAKAMKNQVVKSLSRMTDDIEMQGSSDFATDTGSDFSLSVRAKTKKGKKVLDGLVEEGIVEFDNGMYYISDMNLDEATIGMGEGKLKASGMLEEGSDKFVRFDEGIGEGPMGSSYYGYDRVIENLKPKKADGGMMSVLPKGQEMDYRGGGMIPMGSKERADDVPARLSKNEFVMTADAVRAAGGGSVNRGAKRMYDLMHNLEARV